MKNVVAILAVAALLAAAPFARAHEVLSVKPLAEKKVADLPPGELFWRIENFSSAAEARQAAGAHSLVAEAAGKVWLFTLGARGADGKGRKVAEVGPIPRPAASQYLLRINEATGAPGSETSVHTHPGSEAFYVLSGEQSIRTPRGVMKVSVGQPEPGQGADQPMQALSTGTTPLHALVMFVVDAARPFSTPAKMP